MMYTIQRSVEQIDQSAVAAPSCPTGGREKPPDQTSAARMRGAAREASSAPLHEFGD
jgi:hypothetical protein